MRTDGAPVVIPQFARHDGNCGEVQKSGRLSQRELDVLRLASGGMSNRRIGESLGHQRSDGPGSPGKRLLKLRVSSSDRSRHQGPENLGWLQFVNVGIDNDDKESVEVL